MRIWTGNILCALWLFFPYSLLAQPPSSEADSKLTAKFLINETARLCTQENCCANRRQASSMVVVLQYLVAEGKIESTTEVSLFVAKANKALEKCYRRFEPDLTNIRIGGVSIYSKPPTAEERLRALNSWSQRILVDGKLPPVLSFEDELVLKAVKKTYPKWDSSVEKDPSATLNLLAKDPVKFLNQYGNPSDSSTIQTPDLKLEGLRAGGRLDQQQQSGGGGGGGGG